MVEPEYSYDGMESYVEGKWHYTIDGSSVLITHDTERGIISVQVYHYPDYDRALLAAYRMARLQANR